MMCFVTGQGDDTCGVNLVTTIPSNAVYCHGKTTEGGGGWREREAAAAGVFGIVVFVWFNSSCTSIIYTVKVHLLELERTCAYELRMGLLSFTVTIEG